MRGPKSVAIVHKKPHTEAMNNRKVGGGANTTKKEKASKKSSDAPKRPASAFFIFMEGFRKSFKENFPDVKSCSAVGKAGGEKWKSMSSAEKFPYVEIALKRKAEYDKAVEAYKNKLNDNGGDGQVVEPEKSSSEVHEEIGENESS